jgi:hypothetical protein
MDQALPSLPADPIGTGRTAEVYEWGDDRVLKLLRPSLPREWITCEAEKTAAAHAAGAPTPTVHESIEIEDRFGVVFGRAGPESMLVQIMASPWNVWWWGQELARVHAGVLECRSHGLPELKDVLREKIERADPLSRTQRIRAKDALRSLPDGSAVLHGDFHPDNVFLTPSGPVLIDWNEAAHGAAAADIVRTLWLLSAPAVPPDIPRRRVAVAGVRLLRASYERRVGRLMPITRADLAGWMLPVLAGRLSEGIETEEASLVRKVSQLTSR